MRSMHIRKGDTVVLISGKDKGKKGKVLKVDTSRRRVVVEGINRTKKHMRPSQRNPRGGVVDWELPIDVSNVMLFCSACERPVRVNRVRKGGKGFVRVCKKCDREI